MEKDSALISEELEAEIWVDNHDDKVADSVVLPVSAFDIELVTTKREFIYIDDPETPFRESIEGPAEDGHFIIDFAVRLNEKGYGLYLKFFKIRDIYDVNHAIMLFKDGKKLFEHPQTVYCFNGTSENDGNGVLLNYAEYKLVVPYEQVILGK